MAEHSQIMLGSKYFNSVRFSSFLISQLRQGSVAPGYDFGFRNQNIWAQVQALLLPSYLIISTTFNLDEVQFSHLQIQDNDGACLVGFLRGFNKTIHESSQQISRHLVSVQINIGFHCYPTSLAAGYSWLTDVVVPRTQSSNLAARHVSGRDSQETKSEPFFLSAPGDQIAECSYLRGALKDWSGENLEEQSRNAPSVLPRGFQTAHF